MKNLINIVMIVFCIGAVTFLASCEKENIDETETQTTGNQSGGGDDYDCAQLELNIGDACLTSGGAEGIVNDDCECAPEDNSSEGCDSVTNLASWYDSEFPDGYELSPGDQCWDINDLQGFVNDECECEASAVEYDCSNLQANFGDPCEDAFGNVGNVNASCECEGEISEQDCPGLGNIGDPCQGGWGVVTADCGCVENSNGEACAEVTNLASWYPLEFPDGVELSVGDQCWDANDNIGTVNENCECQAD